MKHLKQCFFQTKDCVQIYCKLKPVLKEQKLCKANDICKLIKLMSNVKTMKFLKKAGSLDQDPRKNIKISINIRIFRYFPLRIRQTPTSLTK